MRPLATAVALLVSLAGVVACGSDNGAETGDQSVEGRPHVKTEETDDGMIAERIDSNGNGMADIVRYYEEYEDPRDETRTKRRIRRMEIDATDDGVYNVIRHYDKFGNVEREETDQNLDGETDLIVEFNGGELSRKQILADDGDYVEEQRIYFEGDLVRVERDEDGDGEFDRWEYYEDGVLMRIGHDTSGDGSADTWQMR